MRLSKLYANYIRRYDDVHVFLRSVIRPTHILRQHRLCMIRRQRRIIRRPILQAKRVPSTRPTLSVRGRELPKLVRRDLRAVQHRLLPRLLARHHIDGGPVLLEDDGLVRGLANRVVLLDPRVAPRLVVPPRVGIQVEGAVIERVDAQVLLEIDAFRARVRVGAIAAGTQPALIAKRDHVRRVEGFNVAGGLRRPVVDDAAVTAVAAGLIHQFPGENGRRGFIPVDDEGDVVLVGGLGGGVGVEGCGVAGEDSAVRVDAAEVIPVVEEGEDELDARFFGGGDDGVEASDAYVMLVSRLFLHRWTWL